MSGSEVAVGWVTAPPTIIGPLVTEEPITWMRVDIDISLVLRKLHLVYRQKLC